MPSKRSSTNSSSGIKPQVSLKARSSCRNGKTTVPQAGKACTSPHHLVLDLSLPSHIISDRSLFTTYTSSRKLHRTVFGNDIIIEGYGDVRIRTFAGTKSILFRLRDCWHVPSSPHHFLSCTRLISQGKQVMLAGRTPRMIYSHKDRLADPQLPKYVPFTQDGGHFVLKFQIPVEVSESGIQPTAAPMFSLHASSFRPFAGMAALSLNPCNGPHSFPFPSSYHHAHSLHISVPSSPLSTTYNPTTVLSAESSCQNSSIPPSRSPRHHSQQTVSLYTTASESMIAVQDLEVFPNVVSNTSAAVTSHHDGGADHDAAQMKLDMKVDVFVNENVDGQAVNPYGGDRVKGDSSATLNSALYKPSPLPFLKPLPRTSTAPQYFVVTTVLPSHVVNDRSLFTTYTPSHRVYQMAFGAEITIEGTGNVEVRVFAFGKSIIFTIHDCWHVPSSPHHFLSGLPVTSRGHQVMLADRISGLLFPQKHHLAEPNLPKYVPFAREGGYFVLKFDVPATQVSKSLPLESKV
jgi:hypothetical protein